MRFRVEFSNASEQDFGLIFDHLTESYLGFGENRKEAIERAGLRIEALRKAANRLATFPARGTARDNVSPGIRSIAIDRAVYWFEVDKRAKRIVIQAVFFGGQDDVRHMLARLLRDGGKAK
jgi:plasmid stabilization system protein ParE